MQRRSSGWPKASRSTMTTKIEPDTDAAVAFARRWAEMPLLVAIEPDGKKGIVTKSFPPRADDKMRAWIEQYQGRWNLYFLVNEPKRAMDRKPAKADMKAMRALHVDVDPEDGKDLEAERTRILEQIRKSPLRPDVVIDSGGGYQAFWLLKDPIPIADNVAELEAQNKRLEGFFGADHCHNIDRIMRLPGTVNVPDEKKRTKGREPALAREVTNELWPR